jgi:phospholipid/cholesterol/gamma-HCH transport system substrate-binding protein
MTTNNNRKAIIVGAFIIVGLAVFLAGILTLGGQKKTFEKKVLVKAIFTDVSGLQTGNNVWFHGVKIGTIHKISFSGKSDVVVEMNLDADLQNYIKKDAKAKIGSESLIGNKIVVIYGGSDAAPAVKGNDVLGVENGLSTDEMMATLQQNNKNLVEVTGNLKTITAEIMQGKGSIGKLINDPFLANSLQQTLAILQRASSNAQQLTANISDYSARLKSPGSLSNELVSDTAVFSHLRSTVAQLHEASMKANQITDSFKVVSSNINQASRNLNSNHSPVGVLLNDPQAGNNLKGTLENLNSGSKKLDEDLEALQHNFLLRGFFKKKAKQADQTKMVDKK